MKAVIDRPEIGQWYMRADKGELFQIVAYDGQAGKIEIQTFDGDLDEIDGASWNSLAPERAAPPENWTGPVDDVDTNDLGYSETDMRPSDWTQPLQSMRVEGDTGEDSGPETEPERDDDSAEDPEVAARARQRGALRQGRAPRVGPRSHRRGAGRDMRRR